MEFDEYGFPAPAEFRDKRPKMRPKITTGRIVMLTLAVGAAGVVAALFHFGPDLAKGLANGVLADRQQRLMDDQKKLNELAAEGKFEQAAEVCDRMLRILPNNERLFAVKAELLFRGSKLAAAVAVCNQWSKQHPDALEPYFMRSTFFSQVKDYRNAIRECNRVLAKAPDDAAALNNRAYFRALARIDLKEAVADVDLALKSRPDDYTYLDTRAYLDYLFGRFERARRDLDRILNDRDYVFAHQDGIGEIYFHRGLVRKATGDAAGMKADYEAAAKHQFKIEDEPPPLEALKPAEPRKSGKM